MGFWSDFLKALDNTNPDADESVREEAKKGYRFFGSDPDEADEDAKKEGGWGAIFEAANEEEDKKDEGFRWF